MSVQQVLRSLPVITMSKLTILHSQNGTSGAHLLPQPNDSTKALFVTINCSWRTNFVIKISSGSLGALILFHIIGPNWNTVPLISSGLDHSKTVDHSGLRPRFGLRSGLQSHPNDIYSFCAAESHS